MEHSVSTEAAILLTRRQQWHALHEHAGLYLDCSKQRITDETLRLLREPRA